ncbi:MAG: hypothetical protein R3A51_18615 [Nannocystaceae bacterium]|nr:hypothetical protein [Myxococcales bacterium]
MTGAAINKAIVRLAQQEVYRYTLGWWKTARVDPYPTDPAAAAVIVTYKNMNGITSEAQFGLDPAGWQPPVVDYLERFTAALEHLAALALKIPFAALPPLQARPYNLQLALAARVKYSLDMVNAGIPGDGDPSDLSSPAAYLSLAQVEEMGRVQYVSANPALAAPADQAQSDADTALLEGQVDQA